MRFPSKNLIRRRNLLVIILVTCLFSAWVLAPGEPRILIIGDSISIGYTPFVQEHFAGKAYVAHSPGNAQHTGTGLAKVVEWIGEDDWDIVQFNWGLWDLCFRHPDSEVQGHRDKVNGTRTYSVEEYRANLDSLVRLMQPATDAKLVFVTTTYIPEDEAGRFQEDARIYNDAAREVMDTYGIAVNDIYLASRNIHKRWGKGTDDVHYTQRGYRKLSEPIIVFLEKTLPTLP